MRSIQSLKGSNTAETLGSGAKQACLDHTIMVLQTQKQLLMPAAQEGADKDEVDIITQELDMDLDADEDNSDLDMLDSDDDGNHSFTTSSTLHCS